MSRIIAPLPITERGFPSNQIHNLDGTVVYGAGSTIVLRTNVDDVQLVNHHQSKVTAVAISPGGSWIASGDNRGQVRNLEARYVI